MPGVIGWNKARLKRIIENEKYMGKDSYPQIIDEETFVAIQRIKASRNTQTDIDRGTDIYRIAEYVICPVCGNKMKRRHDGRRKSHERWICNNKDCRTSIEIADESLIGNITRLLSKVISNPEIIRIPQKTETEQSIEVIKLNNEISRMLNAQSIDKEQLKNKIMLCVSEKYHEIGSEVSTAKRLKDEFLSAKPPDKFPRKLFERTVSNIVLNTDTSAELILKNGQIIREEQLSNADNGNETAESCKSNSRHG